MLHFSPFQKWLVIIISVLGFVFASPNLFNKETLNNAPSFLPKSQLNLGLDLRGGSHLLLEMNSSELLEDWLEDVRSQVRKKVAEVRVDGKKIRRKRPRVVGDHVEIRISNPEHVDAAIEKLREIVQPVTNSVFGGTSNNNLEIVKGEAGLIKVNPTEAAIKQRVDSAISGAIETIRRRIDALGTTEPVIQRQGRSRILVQVPGFNDPVKLKEVIGDPAKLTFQLVDTNTTVEDAIKNGAPPGSELVDDAENAGIKYLLKKQVIVSGKELDYVRPERDQQTSRPVIAFGFNTSGAGKFARTTKNNVGRPFAIVLDTLDKDQNRVRKVLSAPVIQEPILTGQGQISGNFTHEETSRLSLLLRSGSLEASLKIIEERTVGPSLGEDSINAGKIAAIIGLVGVVIFILVTYGLFGVFANVALLINLSLIVGALSMLQATLTLPGIAGIVLTIGMAVDANVLIFERIKEELRNGKNTVNAIDTGYSRAFGTILDANITTFIAAAILFLLGSGPIQGFAVTLAIGIITSVFTACTVTRLMVVTWLQMQKKRSTELPIQGFKILPEGTKISFLSMRQMFLVLSGVLVLFSAAMFFSKGLNYGIDFRGGILVEVASKDKSPIDISSLRNQVSGLGLGEVQVQKFGEDWDALIKVERQEGGDTAQQQALLKIRNALGSSVDYRREEVVGPTVSEELKESGTIAVLTAIFCVLIYIWFRFEWQFSIGAVAALIHDVILTIGIFSLLNLEFGLSIVAALLTIVGYSLNDTVVVFDRVRENLRKYKKMDITKLLDLSINETLSRTILTSVTTLIALLALYIFGGEVLRSFIFAMIWGVLIGTYSSIFIASPVLMMFGVKRDWSGLGGPKPRQSVQASA